MFVVNRINCLSKGKIKNNSEVELCRVLNRFTVLQHIIAIQEGKGCA